MPYVPEHLRTTAWYLFEPRFAVKVPPLALRTLEDIKEFGQFTTGDPVMDREINRADVRCMLNIAKMESIFRKGHSVKVVNYSDTKTIYDYITNHLTWFKEFMLSGENRPLGFDETLDDLIYLDKFASSVYIHAKHFFDSPEAMSVFGRHLAARKALTGAIPVRTLRRGHHDVTVHGKKEEKEKEEPKRTSLESIFTSEKNFMNGSPWK